MSKTAPTKAPTPPKLDPALLAYREQLVTLEQKSQGEYDRTVMALSGGALGVSFAFVDAFLKDGPAQDAHFLALAWASWVASLVCVLTSHYFGTLAIRKAIGQVDRGVVRSETPGGLFDLLTTGLNGAGGLLFVLGAALAGFFVSANV